MKQEREMKDKGKRLSDPTRMKESEKIDSEQKKYLEKVKKSLLQRYAGIFKIWCISCFGQSATIFIFYKTAKELECVDKTEMTDHINAFLQKTGYFDRFGEQVFVEFDSDENVKKNYEGNYYYRIL